MTLADVLVREREALLAEYLFKEGLSGINVPPYCAVSDFEVLLRTPTSLRSQHPVSVEELPGTDLGYAFVQSCASLRYKFLWVHSDNDNYRNDYEAFLRKHYGLKLEKLPSDYHVDHLFNRKRAISMGLRYIRAILLPQGINTSHGAGYEKSRTQSGIGRPGRERGLDEVMLMKLCGFRTPRKGMPLTTEALIHAQHIAALFGLPVSEVERNIQELMDVAKFEAGA